MDVLKAGAGQPEVVQPMIQVGPGDAHGKIPHLGKIR